MSDKLLVIGSGAREQCLAWKLAQSSAVEVVFVVPGNAGSQFLGKIHVCYLYSLPTIDLHVKVLSYGSPKLQLFVGCVGRQKTALRGRLHLFSTPQLLPKCSI